jgi:hypothetical protein
VKRSTKLNGESKHPSASLAEEAGKYLLLPTLSKGKATDMPDLNKREILFSHFD